MPLRDIALTAVILGLLPFVLKRPWIGALLWVWVSVMSPHRLTFGFAYNQQWAVLIALVTLIGMVLSRDPKKLPLTPITIVMILLVVQMNISMIFALNFDGSVSLWDKVMKTFVMLFVVMSLLHTREHVKWLVLILTASIAFYGIKGGIFTIRGGGVEKVYGPGGSFIRENNALAVAVIMTIPLLRYYQLQVTRHWQKHALTVAMLICGVSALGSQSRGGLLAICAMIGFLWLKSRNKFITALLLALALPFAYNFMPESWHERMHTIATYEEDGSAMGRLDAWMGTFNLANDRPLIGGGFSIYHHWILGHYTPSGTAKSAHSIWFQYLGEHGYPGIILYVVLWVLVWRNASWIIRNCAKREGWNWTADLARMIQVSLIGFFVGGTFLQLAYYDVPFYLAAVIVLTRQLIEREAGGLQEKRGWYAGAGAGPARAPSAPAAGGAAALSRTPLGPPGMRADGGRSP